MKKILPAFLLFIALTYQINATINEYTMVFRKPGHYEMKNYLNNKLRSTGKTLEYLDVKTIAHAMDHLTYKEFSDFINTLTREESAIITEQCIINVYNSFIKNLSTKVLTQSESEYATACHEAAHAVSTIHQCKYCKLESVSIIPKEKHSAGETINLCRTAPCFDYTSDTKNKIINYLTGGVAEQLLSQRKGVGFIDLIARKGVADDIEHALVLVFRLMQLTATPEQRDALEYPELYGIDLEYEKFKALESLYPDTVEFVETHKKDILAVANKLIERKVLQGNEVHRLINAPK